MNSNERWVPFGNVNDPPLTADSLLSNLMEALSLEPAPRPHAFVMHRRTYENLKGAGLVPHCYDGSQEDWGDVHHEH